MASEISIIDRARWGRAHWLIFSSASVGFFLWGIINTLGYAFYPEYSNLGYLVTVAAMPLIGDLLLARLSDRLFGRKGTYLLTMLLYGAGSLAVVLDLLFVPKGLLQMVIFLIAYGVALFGVEGEVPVGLSLLAETTPAEKRQKALILAPNFENIGAAAAAAVAYAVYYLRNSFALDAMAVAVMAIAGLTVAVVLRFLMPESARWLLAKGREREASESARALTSGGVSDREVGEASPTVGLGARFAVLTVWALANYLSWSFMAFLFADEFFTGNAVNLIMLAANAGASAAGFAAAAFVDALDARDFTLVAFGTAVASFLPVVYVLAAHAYTLPLISALAFENLFFITFTWFVRTIYEPLLFPTQNRAFMVGLVRSVAISAYTASTYLTASFSAAEFVAYGMAFQVAGLAAAVWWRLRGYDVRMKTLESVSSVVATRGWAGYR